ncbi:PTC2 [[Candida] subhashii]|uniref:protein-serine/threonine phosphatase n=1 Tax=[Candida] subhashii TaxID=561895 RepID=A0A8J5UM73_9ASCO|nr:PTC2 [[Candida] subhashii]KAG7663121.1 PTC2 [[Candida] subhashii]
MGQILSTPATEKFSWDDEDKYLAYSLSCMQGWRINMEDAHSSILNIHDESTYRLHEDDHDHNEKSHIEQATTTTTNKEEQPQQENTTTTTSNTKEHIAFFGVYDGHGGEKAAKFTSKHLHNIIRKTEAFQKQDYINALKQGFLACDQAILNDFYMRDDDSGCAATSAIITPTHIICGNAGDSRTVMSINGYAKALSFDHKPSNEGEKARICAAGGYVDMGRVNGNLALSRGIGDFDFKRNVDLPAEEQIVTCYPDVIQHDINLQTDEFVILACDGIWDCLSSQKSVECVRRGIYERKTLVDIAEEIMDLCCAPTSDGSGIGCDNMSICIVALLDYTKNETLDQWYDKIIQRIEIVEGDKSMLSTYGPISAPYNDIYKEMYGEYYNIGEQGQSRGGAAGAGGGLANGNSIFGRGGYDEDEKEEEEDAEQRATDEVRLNTNAISLQKLLASNTITNENGVIYLDTSSAQSLLAHFGVGPSSHVSGDREDEIDVEHDDDDVLERHTEEDIAQEDEKIEPISEDDEDEEEETNDDKQEK